VRDRLQVALAVLAAAVRAVEHRVVLGAQVRRALDRHAADDDVVELVDLLLREAEVPEEAEARLVVLLGLEAQTLEGVAADDPRAQRLARVEDARQRLLGLAELALREALLEQPHASRVGLAG